MSLNNDSSTNQCNNAASNNMASMTPIRLPFSFSGDREESVEVFINEFKGYCDLLGYSETRRKFSLKFSLRGDVLNWMRSQPDHMSLGDLMTNLINRFSPSNKTLSALRRLYALRPVGNELLRYLDQARLIATSGNLSEEILVASSLIALPETTTSQIMTSNHEGGISWGRLYEMCRTLEDRARRSDKASSIFAVGRYPSQQSPLRNSKEANTERRYCLLCNRFNYSTDYCFKLKERNKKSQNGRK
ncbi:hypothetical protein PAEPH01_2032 [Pancytospora epiphaga]|nr:hypothetical protein PAEPH01_2032 [Pancytospora epiphaga]